LPVADLSTITTTTPIVFPHFADGGGWTTQVVLVNPTDGVLTGNVQFRDASGQSAVVSVNNQISDAFSYSIPARSSVNLKTAGTGTSVTVGSVRVLPSGQTPVPSGLVIFSLQIAGTTVSEAGVPAVSAGSAFRIYAESSGDFTNSSVGSIQTGVAVANTTANPAVVTVELLNFDGLSAVLTGQFSVPANGQKALMLSEIPGLAGAPMPFQGLLRVSSGANISVLGIRARYNERKDILITTVPAANEAIPPSTTALYFPHIASGGGFTTQFILFSSQPGTLSTGTIQLFNQSGGALGVNVQ
jgi:hypothetical protein